jgi:hypothetical protein
MPEISFHEEDPKRSETNLQTFGDRSESKLMVSSRNYGTNKGNGHFCSSTTKRKKKIECIRSSTIERTKKNKEFAPQLKNEQKKRMHSFLNFETIEEK